jgi:DNA-directed RNA polymerase specialized sigma subunit
LGKTSERNQVNHIDGNKLNNNASNLEWCTKHENMRHAFATGLASNKHLAILKDPNGEIAERNKKIKSDYLTGEYTHRQIADLYGLSKSQASKILKGLRRD